MLLYMVPYEPNRTVLLQSAELSSVSRSAVEPALSVGSGDRLGFKPFDKANNWTKGRVGIIRIPLLTLCLLSAVVSVLSCLVFLVSVFLFPVLPLSSAHKELLIGWILSNIVWSIHYKVSWDDRHHEVALSNIELTWTCSYAELIQQRKGEKRKCFGLVW